MKPSEEQTAQPALAHDALIACLDVSVEEGLFQLDPRAGSSADLDFSANEVGPTGQPWSDPDYRRKPAVLAQKFVMEQAGLCRSLELLIDYPATTWDAIGVITRAIAERAARSSWLIDGNLKPRTRFKRAMMLELSSSVERQRSTDAETGPDASARKTASQSRLDTLRSLAQSQFRRCRIQGNDSRKWKIGDEKYRTMTKQLEDWATNNQQSFSGAELYQNLSVLAHPQGLEAGAEGEPENVTNRIKLAMGIFHISLSEFLQYQGIEPSRLGPLESRIENAFPGTIQP